MEGFSSLLNFRIAYGKFIYHPRCYALQLSHVIFADDLFILCGADRSSFQLVNDVLADFLKFSGLRPNLQKSSVYFSGVSDLDKAALFDVLAIPAGVLPVRYLGVPLITTRLHALDCQALIDKILKKVQSWANKMLSYGGRVQLIKC